MGQVILCWDIIKKEMIANHFDKAAANDNAEMVMVMRLQRLLTPEEGLEFTNCLSYKPRPAGNIASRYLLG